ncbi:MAG: hypothetical protein A3A80_02635 [Candidatus Terrybacteria bacterium RIFCSPLOWO2_01_FULL_44_24]|uniref:Type 4 fimbrial biogenesis protein PilO n=1 Tax=Candidatus Terrybacteria bacterium RIFCSPHIGHO2_01_FULL_43_35 TaxID=1802361 RepID=A0A1G2PGM2_9BACT|nr:MAG: hypothetical protein A2828_02430 [Candidatus Terrybacteria bacterium RIFCSPHIGHO2_01_FULL_43_35]OHA50278.1 MAG: hypothetical protein A3B75_00565 [Candidatus Terrybacteria bacterium RIFCSPHIGHO2_02_FULL_43_14]OHA50969.1 MAG: hypothetical protein A3A80_02635 [Candidatus Terrybacteria bacterium RIFCSPLOWO2_01_FULL_44_24]
MNKYRSPKQKFTIALVVCGTLVVAVVGLIIAPLFIQVVSNSAKLKAGMLEQVNEQAKFVAAQETTQDLLKISPQIDKIETFFLADDLRDLSNTLNAIENLAQIYNIDLKKQPTGATKESKGFSLVVRGTFPNIMNFIMRLEQFPKFSKIEGFSLATQRVAEGSNITQELSGSISFVIYLSPNN